MALLRVEELATYFFLDEGELRAVDDVTFEVEEGETVALVGESGCGKTIVAMSILYLFQEPGAALNPVYPIGRQISEVLQLHRGMSKHEADREAVRSLGGVGIPEPEKRVKAYPFELSGGMRQRAVIAIATCTRPRLLIADEPTTALDVTVQAEILDLMRHLQAQYNMATLLITHDLGVVAEMAQRMLVMYTGKLFELGRTQDLFDDPKHPYTQGLLNSVPRLGGGRDDPLTGIPGAVPDLLQLPGGCTFHPRCALADGECSDQFPDMRRLPYGRVCACYKVKDR
jgi:peptide/nickel transport system ATP-binding protein/oligopeptide transport system ATP-binding protein